MLIQVPRTPPGAPGSQNAENCSPFEAGLRRDLASAPIVSYDSVLGGWAKRAIDLAIVVISLPLWLPIMMAAALWAKLRHSAPVFHAREVVGYGGRIFKLFALRVDPPSATIEVLRVPGDAAPAPANDWTLIASRADDAQAKWRRALSRLPMLWNVLRGELALVGPSALSLKETEPLKTARRYYLSARPGVIGVSAIVDAEEEEASQYKIYALSWSLSTDALILWDALDSLLRRGELWKPNPSLKARGQAAATAAASTRRRSAAQ